VPGNWVIPTWKGCDRSIIFIAKTSPSFLVVYNSSFLKKVLLKLVNFSI